MAIEADTFLGVVCQAETGGLLEIPVHVNELAHVVYCRALNFGAEVSDLLAHIVTCFEEINTYANVLSVQGFVGRGAVDRVMEKIGK